ncbi:hypothetical protein SLE2022_049240 [Rubroshorea leprosula]
MKKLCLGLESQRRNLQAREPERAKARVEEEEEELAVVAQRERVWDGSGTICSRGVANFRQMSRIATGPHKNDHQRKE